MDALSVWANNNIGLLTIIGFAVTTIIAVAQLVQSHHSVSHGQDLNTTQPNKNISIKWLILWLLLLLTSFAFGIRYIINLGYFGLVVAVLIIFIIGFSPKWIRIAYRAISNLIISQTPPENIKTTQIKELSDQNSSRIESSFREELSNLYKPREETQPRSNRRYPGSKEYHDLIVALRQALPDQARIARVIDFSGMQRGEIEDGFVDATTRWNSVMRLALDSDMEEAVCYAALDASPRKALRDAVAAYLE